MRRRKNMNRPTGTDAYLGIPATVFYENGTRRTPNYIVRFIRKAFNDPALPPFWELTVGNSRYSYRVILSLPADELETAMQSLPLPSAERNGVDFMRAYKEVILPEDIRRLSGDATMAFLTYKVEFAPPGSPYRKGQRYNEADLTRPITHTDADIAENDRRRDALLRRFEAEIAEARLPSLRF
ncbi:hypothetical protein ACFSQT_11235 [Mesorhizobium calcicola]|uniref:Uncharacterized protein n=1 Tax=Mesorhizobium calcicola TaxID=1300310 RepID=A0ABW4WBR7_9HYPH